MSTPPFREHVSARYGAPMGREQNPNLTGKVHLQRVPFVSGDYDPGGAYWGGGRDTLPLWCAWNDEGARYVRARTRKEAKSKLEGLTFYR